MSSSPSYSLLQGDPTEWGVPPVGKTFLGINASGELVLKQNSGTVTVLAPTPPAAASVVNSSGTTTVAPSSPIFKQIVDIQAAPRAVPIVLSIVGATDGATVGLLVKFPAVQGFDLTIRNENGSGDVLATFNNSGDPVAVSIVYQFLFISGAWTLFSAQTPAY